MDEQVRRAMAKWPNVPACTGWLGLDGRGQWWMRDERAQAAGTFQDGCVRPEYRQAKGSRVSHDALIGFIQRNYAVDERGCWYFQNGPQRVFVELERAPWVGRIRSEAAGEVVLHDGSVTSVMDLVQDEEGVVFAHTPRGLAQIHTQDVVHLVEWLAQGIAPPTTVPREELPRRFGYVLSPHAMGAA